MNVPLKYLAGITLTAIVVVGSTYTVAQRSAPVKTPVSPVAPTATTAAPAHGTTSVQSVPGDPQSEAVATKSDVKHMQNQDKREEAGAKQRPATGGSDKTKEQAGPKAEKAATPDGKTVSTEKTAAPPQ